MGYPGDQGKPGGRPPHHQPPPPPYGPGAEAPPYGPDNDETSFTPPYSPGGEDFGPTPPGSQPFGADSTGPQSFGADPFGAESTGAEPFGGQSFGAGTGGNETFGNEAFGTEASPNGSFGNESFRNESFGAGPGGGETFGAPPFGAPADQAPPWGDESPAGDAAAFSPPSQFGTGGQGADPYGPPADGPTMPSSGPPPTGRRRNLPLVIGGAVVAGILLIGGGVVASSALSDDSKSKKTATPAKTTPQQPQPAPSPTQPVLEPVKLQSRTTDPKPLTLKEAFGNGKFKVGKHRYVRTAANQTKSCAAFVGGAKLEKALKKGGCTQALRATYALTSGSLIGTVGVFNLETEEAAELAVKAAADKDAFLVALPGKGVSKTNGKGEALGTSEARGHYLVMTWVQRPDGKKIATKYHAAVRVFGTQLVKSSNLALALHYRETEGKPLQN
ncbi:hypothetical protein BZB76_1480 [Actinomadura pelletieri DSM 43383]|uniref:Uncharacterized protein n=1 Tax=Actinomadura pelletieri DSM 43383 TaxID=1120940 RepID=A0A495QRK4_9ACTN|nr:hypothetical protein [Actinomadura pelletieri]RKS76130.1 hypothetical protein BZB76_1480 [Actinomadura pelletieri DSM 43383]